MDVEHTGAASFSDDAAAAGSLPSAAATLPADAPASSAGAGGESTAGEKGVCTVVHRADTHCVVCPGTVHCYV